MIYRRLTGRKRTLLGYSQLWLAPDHLLLVKSSRFAEQYQRFALADIQAITVTELRLGGCRCYVHTAVSRELLAPVWRMSVARNFLAEVRPAIEAAQGGLSVEAAASLDAPAADRPPEIVRGPEQVLEVLFGLFLVDAALVLLDMRFPELAMRGVLLTTFFAEMVLGIVALVRRRAHDPRRIAYLIVVAGLLCLGGDSFGLVRAVGGWFTQVAEAARQGRQTPPVFSWASSNGAVLFAAGWRMAAGLTGLAASFFERRAGAVA